MDSFQQDFMQKVKNPTLEGEVVGSSGNPKKSFDKRWLIIGGLVVVLVIVFVILLIISNTKNPDATAQVQGDPIAKNELTGVTWTCSYDATMTFYEDGTVKRITPVSEADYTYEIKGSELSYGKVTAILKNGTLTISHANGDKSTCKKENS